jgi:hypothetical protein
VYRLSLGCCIALALWITRVAAAADNGDMQNDYKDLALFREDFIAAYGSRALIAVVAGFKQFPSLIRSLQYW